MDFFLQITDHKPLLTILGPKSGIPSIAAARMQRWSFILSAYQIFKQTKTHCNADGLSRLPQEPLPTEVTMFNIGHLMVYQYLPAKFKLKEQLKMIQSNFFLYIMNGWPDKVDNEELKPYFSVRNERSLEGNCILRGTVLGLLFPRKFKTKFYRNCIQAIQECKE